MSAGTIVLRGQSRSIDQSFCWSFEQWVLGLFSKEDGVLIKTFVENHKILFGNQGKLIEF